LIAHIATVKNVNGDTFNIGFDCLETLLVNNSLLSAGDIAAYEAVKKMIPPILRWSKTVKDVLKANPTVTGLRFEKPSYVSDWYTFYWLHNHQTSSRDNSNVKFKNMDLQFLLTTLRAIFPTLDILLMD
jgi:hypothetical protein